MEVREARGSLPPAALLEALACAFECPREGLAATLNRLSRLRAGADAKDAPDAQLGTLAPLIDEALASPLIDAPLVEQRLAYARLFVGSPHMEAPPYASYYLDPGQRLFGPTCAAVEETYRLFGVQVGDDSGTPADHLRYLLSFLALLARRFEESGSEEFVEAFRDFAACYLLPWIDDCRALAAACEQPACWGPASGSRPRGPALELSQAREGCAGRGAASGRIRKGAWRASP